MKPIITVYSGGTQNETKKFDGFITAAFWVGLEHTEGDLESVKVRQPNEIYDVDVANLNEFTSLLVQRQINFSVEFFSEPEPIQHPIPPLSKGALAGQAQEQAQPSAAESEVDFESELNKIKEDYQKGVVTKAQYESKKGVLLKKWKEKVEARLGL